MKILMLILTSMILSACTSVPMTSLEADAEAKKFHAPKDNGRIYIYRNENMGSLIKVTVTVDGQMIGQTAPMTYFTMDVAPGIHKVQCAAEHNAEISVKVDKGESTYIWQEMKMGLMQASCMMNKVDKSTGQAAISQCKRAKNL